MVSELVTLDGHVIDSLTLSKVLDIVFQHGLQMEMRECKIGHTRNDPSHVEILIRAESQPVLDRVLHEVQQHGAQISSQPAQLAEAELDGVFPDEFYSTTNLATAVRLDNHWIPVEPIEMDCGIRVWQETGRWRAEAVPMHRLKARDKVVVGYDGVKVTPLQRREATDAFAFMGSDVSSEKPKERVVRAVAEKTKTAKANGQKILLVGGPAIVHTGAGPYLERLIRNGWIDVLFAGNALATHDIESALFGTSLGVNLQLGAPVVHGHEHHLRAINAIRRAGSIRNAVETGVLQSGIMYSCIKAGVEFVLAGSIRDDGPLPDVETDAVQAQDRMRELIQGVGVALMVATTLHSVATGNLLPAEVATFCVDNDADTVIKLTDRGSHQAFGIVTDCEFFMKELANHLTG